MKSRILKLKSSLCVDFFISHLSGWGSLTSKLVDRMRINSATFYCIAPSTIDPDAVFQFTQAKGMNESTPFADDIITSIASNFLSSKKERYLVVEDYSSEPWFDSVNESRRKFFLSDNVMFYLINSGSKDGEIEKTLSYAKGYGFCPMLVEEALGSMKPFENISQSDVKKIVDHTLVAFTPIYDGESYLIWCDQSVDFNGLVNYPEIVLDF